MSAPTLRLRPVTNRLRQAVRGPRDLETAAVHREVLQEEEIEPAPPLLHLPAEIDRATAGVAGHSTLEEEVERARLREFVHQPVIRLELHDCLVHPTGVEAEGASLRFEPPPPRALLSPMAHVRRACYCNTKANRSYFGHFLRDGCATALLAEVSDSILLDWRPDWTHAPEYLRGLRLQPTPGRLVRANRLKVFRDHGQGSLKKARYAEMRRRLESAFPGAVSGPSRVYLRRGATGVRRTLVNEDRLAAALADRGFEVVDVAGARAEDLLRRFRTVDQVVSIDGSHLNHLYFSLPAGAGLLTLIPADRFTMNQRGFAAALNLRYGFTIIEPCTGGYEVDLARLLATLALFD